MSCSFDWIDGRMVGKAKPCIRVFAVLWLSLYLSHVGASSISNPGFEPSEEDGISGWGTSSYGHVVHLDFLVKHSGSTSLKVESAEAPRGSMVSQEIDPELVRHAPLNLSGFIKTKEIDGTATFFVIVEGPDGQIFQDDMRDRPAVGTSDWQKAEIRIPRFREATHVKIGALVIGGGAAWFDSMKLTSVSEDAPLSPAAKQYLDEALDVLAQHSVKRESVDWGALRSQAYALAGAAQEIEDTYPAIRYAVQALKDGHSSFVAPTNAVKSRSTSETSQPRVEIGREGAVGYIKLPAFQNRGDETVATEFIDVTHRALRDLSSQGVCGWVLDLRENTGGNMWPMIAAVGPILSEGTIGGFIDPVTGARFEWWYTSGAAGTNSRKDGRRSTRARGSENPPASLDGPVAVLTSRQTSSSGEAVVVAFRGRPGARSFGEPTGGLATANTPYSLKDGAFINLTTMYMTDRMRNRYSYSIAPDVAIELSSDGDAVLGAARRWLLEQGCEEIASQK